MMPLGRVAIFGWADSVHVQRWVKGLSARGYEIRVISLDGSPIPGIDTVILPRRGPWSYFTQVRRAADAAREFHPDLVHVHYAGGFGLWGARCDFAPLLVSVWGADVIDLPRNPLWHLTIGRTLKRACHITATSEFLKEACVSRYPGVRAKIEVIPFGVELPEETTACPGAPPVRLCYIKLHRKKYGPDILIRAFAAARQRGCDLYLTMAGEGDMTPKLKCLAADLAVQPDIDFVGGLAHKDVCSLLQSTHIMVMPSIMASESFGVAAIEAAAYARPVIASRVGGVPEVVQDGVTGILVPPGDVEALTNAIVRLSGDLDACVSMGLAGRRFVRERYAWEHSLDLMSALYEQVIHETSHYPPV
jgi:L-malate glycosyltransferase